MTRSTLVLLGVAALGAAAFFLLRSKPTTGNPTPSASATDQVAPTSLAGTLPSGAQLLAELKADQQAQAAAGVQATLSNLAFFGVR